MELTLKPAHLIGPPNPELRSFETGNGPAMGCPDCGVFVENPLGEIHFEEYTQKVVCPCCKENLKFVNREVPRFNQETRQWDYDSGYFVLNLEYA